MNQRRFMTGRVATGLMKFGRFWRSGTLGAEIEYLQERARPRHFASEVVSWHHVSPRSMFNWHLSLYKITLSRPERPPEASEMAERREKRRRKKEKRRPARISAHKYVNLKRTDLRPRRKRVGHRRASMTCASDTHTYLKDMHTCSVRSAVKNLRILSVT